jgi:hypothetical protein
MHVIIGLDLASLRERVGNDNLDSSATQSADPIRQQ